MQNKVSIIGLEARNKAIKGANYIADAVKQTLGLYGLNAMVEKGNKISNDGVFIAKELVGSIKDEFERRGATVFVEAASKTNDQVGDATTTSVVLAQAILKEAIRYLPNERTFSSKKTPAEVLKMINDARDLVIEKLESMTVMIENEETLVKSALVSVENEELAELIGKTQWELGADGFIIAEETNAKESTIEKVKGIRFDNGFAHSLLINKMDKEAMEVENCHVIYTNYTLSNLVPLKDIIESLVGQGINHIAIIARAFTPECIQAMAANRQTNVFFYPINAPFTAGNEIMKDMEAVIGGNYIDTEESALEDMQLSNVGFATKIISRRSDTIITGRENDETRERVEKRVNKLKEKLQGTLSDFEHKLVETRISQLENGFAILKVGAKTETERKYKKDKADDAVNAVRLALKGGTIRGAGLALKEVSDSLEDDNILKKPLLSINDQIMSSAPEGFEVAEWVRDPLLVIKSALENACSVASTLATTNTIIATENPPKCNCNKSQNNEE